MAPDMNSVQDHRRELCVAVTTGELLTMSLEINSQDTVVDSLWHTVLSFQIHPGRIGANFRTQFSNGWRVQSGREEANLSDQDEEEISQGEVIERKAGTDLESINSFTVSRTGIE